MSDEYKKEYYEFLNYAAAIKELELFNGYTKERAADVLAGQIKATADAIAFGLGLAASFAAPGLATVILTSAGFAVDAGTTAFCYAIGDDEEAQQRIVAMAMDGAFESLGAVTKYADEVTGLTYANKLDIDSDFKGFNLDDSEIFFKNTDDIKPLENSKPDVVDDIIDKADDVAESGTDIGNVAKRLDTNNIPNMTKQDIINSIPDDWNYTENNGFVHIRDADGNIRIRIDPPDKVTNYPHVHAYDRDGNLLDSVGNIVDRKSPDGHIPYKDG